jgi:hypothetical protein
MPAKWPANTNTSVGSVNLFSLNIDLDFGGLDFGSHIHKKPRLYKNEKYSLNGVIRINYIIETNSNNWKTVSFWRSQHDNVRDIIFEI